MVEPTPFSTTTALPLAVDLDGTLIRSDVFTDSILRFVLASPLNCFVFIGWMAKGLAYAKARVAEAAPFDPAALPYDQRVAAWLLQERGRGRRVVLATAADERAARAVAAHVGLFDEVYASDGQTNLKAARKAARLSAAFPEGYVYAGNETPDLKVWSAAAGAVVVNAGASLVGAAAALTAIERTFPPTHNRLAAFVDALGARYWAANALVFVGLLTGQGWSDPDAWRWAIAAFFAVSFTASSIHLGKDIAAIDADRGRGRDRPFASGALSPLAGVAGAPLLLAFGLTLGGLAHVAMLVALHAIVLALYTFWLRGKFLAGEVAQAALYTLRVVIGGAAAASSNGLFGFSCFFFLSLALMRVIAKGWAHPADDD
jgi:hypothetical protein